jgi:lipopolysaccharide transport system permease protein
MSTVRALRNAWGARDYVLASVRREFVSRYLGTQLGFFWAIAQPLAMIGIYTVVFAEIMKPGLPGHAGPYAYGIYLCAGIVVWQLFSEIFSRSINVFVDNANLLKKVSLPKFTLPAVVGISGLANFAVVFALFVVFLALVGRFPGLPIVALLPALVVVVALALGLGVLLGTINVFYRDVAQVASLVLGFWFWLTPIVYPARSVPGWVAAILEWNPMWPLVSFAQVIFLDARVPDWTMLIYPAAVALIAVALGLRTFRGLAGELVDEL